MRGAKKCSNVAKYWARAMGEQWFVFNFIKNYLKCSGSRRRLSPDWIWRPKEFVPNSVLFDWHSPDLCLWRFWRAQLPLGKWGNWGIEFTQKGIIILQKLLWENALAVMTKPNVRNIAYFQKEAQRKDYSGRRKNAIFLCRIQVWAVHLD